MTLVNEPIVTSEVKSSPLCVPKRHKPSTEIDSDIEASDEDKKLDSDIEEDGKEDEDEEDESDSEEEDSDDDDEESE